METIYENSEIWGNAMRESCSRKGHLSLTAELHLQKVSTSSVRRSMWAAGWTWDAYYTTMGKIKLHENSATLPQMFWLLAAQK